MRGVIQRLIHRQFHVDDVFLRDEADVIADGIEVRIDVDVVDQYARRRRGGTIARNRIHEGGFAAAALTDDDDELARLERHRDVLQDVQVFSHPFVQPDRIDPQAVAVIIFDELVFAHHQPVLTDADGIFRFEPHRAINALAVDEGAVGTAQVFHPVALTDALDLGVEARDVRRGNDHIVGGVASDLDERVRAKYDILFEFLCRHPRDLIADRDHHAGVEAAEAQDVSMPEYARCLQRTPFEQDGILRIRQDGELVTAILFFQAGMPARNDLRRDDDVIPFHTTEGDHLLVQRMNLLVFPGNGDDQLRRTHIDARQYRFFADRGLHEVRRLGGSCRCGADRGLVRFGYGCFVDQRDGLSKLDLIPRVERLAPSYALPVDERSVAAAEILDEISVAFQRKPGVAAGNNRCGDRNIHTVVAPENDFRLDQLEFFGWFAALAVDQSQFETA